MFQSFYLEPTFTVLDNVAMPLIIAGIDRKQREENAREVLKLLNGNDKHGEYCPALVYPHVMSGNL